MFLPVANFCLSELALFLKEETIRKKYLKNLKYSKLFGECILKFFNFKTIILTAPIKQIYYTLNIAQNKCAMNAKPPHLIY